MTTDGEKRSEGPGDFWIQSAKFQWSSQTVSRALALRPQHQQAGYHHPRMLGQEHGNPKLLELHGFLVFQLHWGYPEFQLPQLWDFPRVPSIQLCGSVRLASQ